jgi:hypothetical protein
VPGVYALGDVKGGPAFTHIAYDDYRIVRDNLLHDGGRTVGDRPVPYAVFTDPQLGRIGLSESDARKAGKTVRIAKMGMERVARAVEIAEPRGFIKVVVDAETDQILGAAVLGVEGGELMAMLQIAMMGRAADRRPARGRLRPPDAGRKFQQPLRVVRGVGQPCGGRYRPARPPPGRRLPRMRRATPPPRPQTTGGRHRGRSGPRGARHGAPRRSTTGTSPRRHGAKDSGGSTVRRCRHGLSRSRRTRLG